MTQELSPELTAPEPVEEAALRPGFLGWLGRRASALQPRSRRHWALYGFLFLLFLFSLFEYRTSTTFPVTVFVTEERGVVGISPYVEGRLDFGDLPVGGSGTLRVILANGGRIPTRISIVPVGDVRQFIRISDAFFVLSPGDSKEVEFTLVVPNTARSQGYTGRVLVIRTPWPPWP